MSETNRHHDQDITGKLRMENDFIKMKLMLEHGASFQSGKDSKPLDPATEYVFLQQVLAFEKQQRNGPRMTVFKKLGCPEDIRELSTIPDEEIPEALAELHRRMNRQGIHLSSLRDDISPREMYRFMTGEFLDVELPLHDTPGLHCFVYDAFHPEQGHENERIALDYCIRLILGKKNLMHMFPPGRPLKLNSHEALSDQSLRSRIHEFKSRYTDIVCLAAETKDASWEDDVCRITGTHTTGFCETTKCSIVRGEWLVEFHRDTEGCWMVTNIQIGGVKI